MTQITIQDGKIVMRDGKVGTGEACCCRDTAVARRPTVCDETCGWPRFLSVTVAGFPDGYYWASRNGGQPPAGGGFEPACGDGANAGNPQVRFGGTAVGTSGYGYSARYRDLNATFTAEYVEESGCTCPQWYGDIPVTAVGGNDNLPADECPSPQLAGMTITLCRQESYVNLLIGSPAIEGGQRATAVVTEISSGAISATQITSAGSGYAYLETERVEPTVVASIDSATGSGAELSVTLSQTTDFNGDDVWEVAGVTVDSPGSGYLPADEVVFTVTDGGDWFFEAWATLTLNRLEPTLGIDASSLSGSGAEFSVSLTAATDFDGNDVWQVDSVTVIDGGTGYSDGDSAAVELDPEGIEQSPSSLTIRTVRGEPELTLTGEADLTVNIAALEGTPEAWEITSIDVTDGGSGYSDGQYLDVVLGPSDVQEPFAPAALRVKTVRDEPTVSVTAYTSSGAGAVFSVTVVQSGDVWIVDDVEVVNGGAGYSEFDGFLLDAAVGQAVELGYLSVTLDENGTITAVSIAYAGEFFLDTGVIEEVEVLGGGRFFKDTGVIESVEVADGGEYYETDGAIESVDVLDGGNYYKDQTTGNIIVNTPTVTVISNTGRDAVITATVEDDPLSANFGKVVALTIDNGGQKYAIEGPSWFLSFEGFGLYPLEGRRPGFPEGTFFLPAVEPICQGEDQSGEAGFFSDRVALTECGEELLSRTYSAYYSAGIVQFGVANMPGGASYSLSSPPFRDACSGLAVVDWGSGPMTVAISPA